MGLDSSSYLLFLGCVAGLSAVLPSRGRVALLLIASLIFYAVSDLRYLILALFLCVLNYAAVLRLSRQGEDRCRTIVFFATLALNLAVLILFKYAHDVLGTIVGHAMGTAPDKSGLWTLGIPLGISYVTFQMISALTDAYRGTWAMTEGGSRFVLFGFFFPQISSGPIPRANHLIPQFTLAKPTTEDVLAGLRLIAFGFFKKYAVANRMQDFVSQVFEGNLYLSTWSTLAGCCLNAIQLYADFSGYVDIAIGSARVLGIRLDPNFDRPFVSSSVTEFWRRWHMTLAFWLRDYVYMPLLIRIREFGRAGIAFAMIFTFALCGIWHGATWTFLLFGVAQGVAMSAEMLTKSWRTKNSKTISKRRIAILGTFYTLSFFVLSQVLFRSADLSTAGRVYASFLHLNPRNLLAVTLYQGPFFTFLAVAGILTWAALASYLPKVDERSTPRFLFFCAVAILFLGRSTAKQFIYAAF